MTQPLRVGVAGLGTVGAALIAQVARERDVLVARCGRAIEIVAVCARSRAKDRDVDLKKMKWFADPVALARDPEIDVFVELIGGAGDPAKSAVEAALAAGKSVVTANKALLAKRGTILLDCTLSGTGAQARVKDLVVYASGDRKSYDRIAPVLDGFARAHYYVGAFGAGFDGLVNYATRRYLPWYHRDEAKS